MSLLCILQIFDCNVVEDRFKLTELQIYPLFALTGSIIFEKVNLQDRKVFDTAMLSS